MRICRSSPTYDWFIKNNENGRNAKGCNGGAVSTCRDLVVLLRAGACVAFVFMTRLDDGYGKC